MAEDDVGVGHGRRLAAAAVGGGAGLGARRLRADPQRAGQLRHVGDRAAARADRVHVDDGILIRNWPIVVSRPIVGSPAWQSETSVEVPPMSKVSTFG